MFGDTITVTVDADSSGRTLPRRFRLGARGVEVADILDRWPGADHLYVKLRGADTSYARNSSATLGGSSRSATRAPPARPVDRRSGHLAPRAAASAVEVDRSASAMSTDGRPALPALAFDRG